MSLAVHETPEPEFCGHCGSATMDGLHDACVERLRMEPPRFCAVCRRRMTVQVSPTSWTARCVEHGEISTQTTAP